MKLVVGIIRPHRLEAVKEALARKGFHGMTVSDVQGVGRQRGHTEVYRGSEYVVDLLRKVKLEIAVQESQVDSAVEALMGAARSEGDGKIGDGKVFVLPLQEVVRVRTGERGLAAV